MRKEEESQLAEQQLNAIKQRLQAVGSRSEEENDQGSDKKFTKIALALLAFVGLCLGGLSALSLVGAAEAGAAMAFTGMAVAGAYGAKKLYDAYQASSNSNINQFRKANARVGKAEIKNIMQELPSEKSLPGQIYDSLMGPSSNDLKTMKKDLNSLVEQLTEFKKYQKDDLIDSMKEYIKDADNIQSLGLTGPSPSIDDYCDAIKKFETACTDSGYNKQFHEKLKSALSGSQEISLEELKLLKEAQKQIASDLTSKTTDPEKGNAIAKIAEKHKMNMDQQAAAAQANQATPRASRLGSCFRG